MKQKNFIAPAKALCICCLLFLSLACSSDIDILPRVQTGDKSIQDLVTLSFKESKVVMAYDSVCRTALCEESYELLENGDYEFTYEWPFQTAKVVVQNTQDCQFGRPYQPLLRFSYIKDNVYEARMYLELVYYKGGEIKTTGLSGSFAIVAD